MALSSAFFFEWIFLTTKIFAVLKNVRSLRSHEKNSVVVKISFIKSRFCWDNKMRERELKIERERVKIPQRKKILLLLSRVLFFLPFPPAVQSVIIGTLLNINVVKKRQQSIKKYNKLIDWCDKEEKKKFSGIPLSTTTE